MAADHLRRARRGDGRLVFYAAAQRARSDDPAIRVEGPIVLFHVNPGRRIELRREEIRGIGPVRDVAQAVQRAVLGSHVFEVATTRPEGLRASSILVRSRFVAEDLAAVRDRLAEALREPATER